MEHYTAIILGAGPSGLSLAHALIDRGIPQSEILVLEKELEAGGLCRSAHVDGAPLDIGGGHFLDIRQQEVLDFVFRFMPEEEWNRFDRISRIHIHDQMVDHPYEANLWQLDEKQQKENLESIAKAGCLTGADKPEAFSDWIRWKFGERIANDYMLPYNRKIWSMDLAELGTYWLYKLPDVSYEDTLESCRKRKPCGKLPAHGVFLYPKEYGYGEVWRRMGESLGESLQMGVTIEKVDLDTLTINDRWSAKHIFSSVPWSCWIEWTEIPDEVKADIKSLRHVSIDIDYVPDTIDDPSHWIYEPDESIAHHRKLLRSNFAPGSRGYWTETNACRSSSTTVFRHRNEHAYPVNTVNKPEQIARILKWADTQGIHGFGRWGTWEHMNSDIAVKQALELAATHTMDDTN